MCVIPTLIQKLNPTSTSNQSEPLTTTPAGIIADLSRQYIAKEKELEDYLDLHADEISEAKAEASEQLVCALTKRQF